MRGGFEVGVLVVFIEIVIVKGGKGGGCSIRP